MTTGATRPELSRSGGRPDPGAAAAYVGELYSSHGRMVLGLCRLLLRHPAEAEDAAQASFVSAHRALLSGAVPRDPPAWLAAIARNECRARARARRREPLALAEVPDRLDTAIDAVDLDAIWRALAKLPRRQRKALLLRELGGLSYRELGVALGVSRPAVESLLFRARQHLRSLAAGLGAFAPLGLRDQLARLLPGAGTGAAGVPLAAKVAAVTAGVGLGAAGVAAIPDHHGRSATAPRERSRTARVKPEPHVAVAPRSVAAVSEPTAFRPGPAAARHEGSRPEERDQGRDEAAVPRHEDDPAGGDETATAPAAEPEAAPAVEQTVQESQHGDAALSEGEGTDGSGRDGGSDSGPSSSGDAESHSGHD